MTYNVIQSIDKPNSKTFDVIDGEITGAGYPKTSDYRIVQRGMSLEEAKQLSSELNNNARRWG